MEKENILVKPNLKAKCNYINVQTSKVTVINLTKLETSINGTYSSIIFYKGLAKVKTMTEYHSCSNRQLRPKNSKQMRGAL
jgi:hypothetical protein